MTKRNKNSNILASINPVADDALMSSDELGRLDILERRIKTAWGDVGLALGEIKDGKLYRRTRDGERQTWEEYCQRVHDITPQWANKLIKRAILMKEIKAKTETTVSLSASAVGELEGLTAEEQVEIIQDASNEGQRPTAKTIANVRRRKGVDTTAKGGSVTSGGRTVPGSNIHTPTVIVFNNKDETALLDALVEWSPSSVYQSGSVIYKISVQVPKEQRLAFLQKVINAVSSQDEGNFWIKW